MVSQMCFGVWIMATVMGIATGNGCPFMAGLASVKDVTQRGSINNFDPLAVERLDWKEVKKDLEALMSDSQEFWPADDGYYGGLMVRLAWHCAGSYRTWDGRGGCDGAHQRFDPERSWPDNTNLDKARRLLQPLKLKYGDALSWGDLIVLAGNVAIEAAGGPSLGFCGGRIDSPNGVASLPLGPTPQQDMIAPCKVDGQCKFPLGQSKLGLIYVNPGGFMDDPDPIKSAEDLRQVFGNMGWSDQQIVALSGGHNLGKTHGACPSGAGPGPDEDPANPWPGTCGEGPMKGKGHNGWTTGFEGRWTETPSVWTNNYFNNLLEDDWELTKSPGGKYQYKPARLPEDKRSDPLPDIRMLTTDVALIKDEKYLPWVKLYAKNATRFDEDFAAVLRGSRSSAGAGSEHMHWCLLFLQWRQSASHCKQPTGETAGS